MKICPKCNKEHTKDGNFCSRSCANSRVFTDESKEKKKLANKKFIQNLSEEEKREFYLKKIAAQDFEKTQSKATQAKQQKAWNKPYEEMGRDSLRKRLLVESEFKCSECSQGTEYNGKYLPLELDHIDGNNTNNKRENLRILCPNCHSQTSTFRARNIKTNKQVDVKKLTELLTKYKFATPALRELGIPNTGSKMRLANEILSRLKLEGKV